MKINTNKIYDIIIIGAGSGGLNVAGFFSRLKLRVLLVDKSATHIGGDCLNTGCVPSKALIHIANQIYEGKLSKRFLNSNECDQKVDIKKVTEYIQSKQDIIRESENTDYLKNKGIDFVSGDVKFINKNTISVTGENYTAKKIVLATGSRARKLSIENDNSLSEYNNENIFNIEALPEKFLFIGGGPINCELGQAFSRLGSKVTILNTGPRLLEKESLEASRIIEQQFISEGIDVINSIQIEKIENKKVYFKVDNKTENLEADAVFVGIGRELNISGLDLEKAGVDFNGNKTKLIVDDYLRTTNKNMSVVGDVAGNYQFTHAAEMHAKIVIGNMFSPLKKKFDASLISWVTYTTPEIATFGISEELATKSNYEVISKSFSHEDRSVVDENQDGVLKLYINKKGNIQGGTMISKNAGEISQELMLAMSNDLNLNDIFNKVYPYPTATRINRQITGEWVSRKLTKTNIKLLRILYKLF